MARVYAIASAKGGVGKTTTTANLGTVLSMAGHDVVVVDGDLGMPNLAGALGVDPDGATLHDVLTGETTVESATYEGPEGLSVVPGSNALEAFASANAKELHPVVAELESRHDIVLIDTGAGLSDDTFVPLKLADEVLLVSTTEREALGDTEKTRQLGERIGADVVGVVLTRVNQSNPNADEVASLLDTGVIAVVPEDPSIREALDTQTPVVARSPQSIAAAGYRALAEALTGTPVPIPDDTPDEPTAAGTDDEPSPTTDAGPEADAGTDSTSDSDSDTDTDTDSDAVPDDARGDEEPVVETDAEPVSDSATDDSSPASTDDSDESVSESESDPSPPSAHEAHPTEPEAVDKESLDADATSDTTTDATSDTTTDRVSTAEAALEAETESFDDAIPFGGGREESTDSAGDPLAGDADDAPVTADSDTDDEDPLASDLGAAEPTGADPLAGDAVVEATSDGSATTGVDVPAADPADPESGDTDTASPAVETESPVVDTDTDTADADSDPAAPTDADDEPVSSPEASPVIDEAPDPGADPLVAEAEPDATEEDSTGTDDEGDKEGVYTTSLVEEVESLDDDEDDDKNKGFFSRFLG